MTQSPNLIQSPKVLLMGPAGVGKTWSLSTYLEAGLDLFVISTEPNGMETLFDAVAKKGLDRSKLHWRYISPVPIGFEPMIEMAKKITLMGQEDLAKLKTGISKTKCTQFVEVLECLKDFKDSDGKSWGSVMEFDHTKAFVIDSLTGISTMAMDLTVGYKPTAHQGEWGIAMNVIRRLLSTITSSCSCHVCITAHVAREKDEVTQAERIMVSTLGRKLAPELPPMFSEVVLAVKNGANFSWSTATTNVETKNRALPIQAGLPPTFEPLVSTHLRRLQDAGQLPPEDASTSVTA